ncbi:Retrotransposon-like protein 1, partial [Ophiophagus hannah]
MFHESINSLQSMKNANSHSRTLTSWLPHLPEGMEMDPENMEVLQGWQPPGWVKDVLLDFVNYYCTLILWFASFTTPLSNLLQKRVKFYWDTAEQDTFDAIKAAFASEPILKRGLSAVSHTSLHSFGYPVPLCLLFQEVILGEKEHMGQGATGHKGGLPDLAVQLEVWTDHRNMEHLYVAQTLKQQQEDVYAKQEQPACRHIPQTWKENKLGSHTGILLKRFTAIEEPVVLRMQFWDAQEQDPFLAACQTWLREGLFHFQDCFYIPLWPLQGLDVQNPSSGFMDFWVATPSLGMWTYVCSVDRPKMAPWTVAALAHTAETMWGAVSMDFITELQPSKGATTVPGCVSSKSIIHSMVLASSTERTQEPGGLSSAQHLETNGVCIQQLPMHLHPSGLILCELWLSPTPLSFSPIGLSVPTVNIFLQEVWAVHQVVKCQFNKTKDDYKNHEGSDLAFHAAPAFELAVQKSGSPLFGPDPPSVPLVHADACVNTVPIVLLHYHWVLWPHRDLRSIRLVDFTWVNAKDVHAPICLHGPGGGALQGDSVMAPSEPSVEEEEDKLELGPSDRKGRPHWERWLIRQRAACLHRHREDQLLTSSAADRQPISSNDEEQLSTPFNPRATRATQEEVTPPLFTKTTWRGVT